MSASLQEGLSAASAAQPDSFLLKYWASVVTGTKTFEEFASEVRKKRQLTYLTIDTTGACDLTCSEMCYYNPDISLKKHFVSESALTDAIRDAADQLSMHLLAFAGKEPFLNPDRLFKLLRFAGSIPHRDFLVGVVTNGRHIARNASRIREMASAGWLDYVDVSIDSAESEQHDLFRGAAGTHQLAVDAVHWLNDEAKNVRTTVVSVLRWENQDSILRLIQSLSLTNHNFQIQPIQPPPYSSIPPLTAAHVVDFLSLLIGTLAGPLAGAGITVSIELLGVYLLEAVQAGLFCWADIREDENNTLYVEQSIGGNSFVMTCEVFPLQAWRLARITYNGAYLPHMQFLQSANPDDFAVGSLEEDPITTLFDRSIGPGSHFERVIRSREGHDCAIRPCWWNCFGGWNGAENAFLEKRRKLSDQPRLCTKTVDDFTRLEGKYESCTDNLS